VRIQVQQSDVSARDQVVLAADQLTVTFGGVTALEAVSVEIAAGEVLGVIGPNGAGKTTLFNVICGFITADSGRLSWHGRPLSAIRPDGLAGIGIARTLQGVGLFPGLTMLENVMVGAERFRKVGFGRAMLGLHASQREERALAERALEMLRRFGCADEAHRLPGTLPFAVQKKVALARALVAEPELLLLDEPGGGLGAEDLAELQALVQELRGSVAVMVVEHRMDFVMAVCDRVAVLDFGRVIATGDPAEVQRNKLVHEAYLGREAAVEPSTTPAGAGDARG
jgi:branched-chain amino acid transport system ATP-binding protein